MLPGEWHDFDLVEEEEDVVEEEEGEWHDFEM
jgi:hypothetical protein